MNEELAIEEIKELLDEFRRFHKTCHGLMNCAVKSNDIELSPDQTRLLFLIDLDKITQQKDIANKLRITPATLSVRLQRLEKAGYLHREIDPNDKRNYILKVKPKGKELVKQSITIIEKVSKQLFKDFTREDMDVLFRYSKRMKNNVRKIKEDL